jgi:ribonuclease D
MITTAEDLQALIDRARETDAVALDTEFIWERTYYPKLGLIQLGLSDEECFLIDPCALDDLSPLGELLADPTVVKIFHDAPQDLCILRMATGRDPKNIFDTRLAAGFGGLSSTLSLVALLEFLLDIKLEKNETRTNWLKRPLSNAQAEYAKNDVRYLRAMRILLLARVLPETQPWLAAELARLDTPDNYTGIDDTKRYTKIKGNSKLDCKSLSILQELCTWRETEARKQNKPRGHIIKDNVLLSIAKEQLRDPKAIQNCGQISTKSVNTYGDNLIQLVNLGMKNPEEECPPLLRRVTLNKKEKEAFTNLLNYIRLKSDVNGVDPALIGNKNELMRCVKNTSPSTSRQKKGWRKEFLAEMKTKKADQ